MITHYNNKVSVPYEKFIVKSHYSVYINATILVFIFYSLCLSQITAAVAANMQYAMDEICIVFTKKHGIKVTPIYGAPGNLVAQIRNGAPFDIFISADMARPESLFTGGYAAEKPEIYAFGKLILWTTKNLDLSKGISITTNSSIKSIALGDMTSTVYGPAAKQVLERSGLWDRVKPFCIFGSTISQVAHYIVSGSVDLGIAAKSTVLSDNMIKKGNWIDIDSSLYDPIRQGVTILSCGLQKHSVETRLLYDFLFSSDAQNILTKYGYGLP